MKKAKSRPDDLAPEYDFTTMKGGVRGKYAKRVQPDVAVVPRMPKPSPRTAARRSGR